LTPALTMAHFKFVKPLYHWPLGTN